MLDAKAGSGAADSVLNHMPHAGLLPKMAASKKGSKGGLAPGTAQPTVAESKAESKEEGGQQRRQYEDEDEDLFGDAKAGRGDAKGRQRLVGATPKSGSIHDSGAFDANEVKRRDEVLKLRRKQAFQRRRELRAERKYGDDESDDEEDLTYSAKPGMDPDLVRYPAPGALLHPAVPASPAAVSNS